MGIATYKPANMEPQNGLPIPKEMPKVGWFLFMFARLVVTQIQAHVHNIHQLNLTARSLALDERPFALDNQSHNQT